MKKLTTFASASVLALAATQASAAIIDVTAVLSGGATGSATGTYDDVSQILTLNYVSQQDTSAPSYAAGVMELTGVVVADFSGAPTATNAVTGCASISGVDSCGYAGVGGAATPANTVTGDWLNFTTVTSSFGANATINYAVTPEVPVPAAAWLFGSALMGLAGVARRRKA